MILAGIYGISGPFFKIYRSATSYLTLKEFELKESHLPNYELWETPNLELTAIFTDLVAFTLIGIGSLFAIISEIDNFPVSTDWLFALSIFQIVVVYLSGFFFRTVNKEGYMELKYYGLILLPFLGLFIVLWAIWFIIAYPSASGLNTTPPWFKLVALSIPIISMSSAAL